MEQLHEFVLLANVKSLAGDFAYGYDEANPAPNPLRPRAFGGFGAEGMNRSESKRSVDRRNAVKSTGGRLPRGSPKGGARRHQKGNT
jgi:hypothetical protein